MIDAGFLEQFSRADYAAAALNQAIDWLEGGVIGQQRLCNIQYHDLIDNPVAVVERMYSQFGIAMSDKAKRALDRYMAKTPRSSRPAHAYDVGDQGLVSKERRAYKRYQEYFGVSSEV